MSDEKKMAPHWYMQYYGECPVCGRPKHYRVRVYGRRPKDASKRYEYLSQEECYDHCDVGVR